MKDNDLIVIRLSSLGDVAMLVPVLISFHFKFPNSRVKLISREHFRPIFEMLTFVEYIAIDKSNSKLSFIDLIHFFINLDLKRNHIILDLHNVIRSKILRFLFGIYRNPCYVIDKGREEKKKMIKFESKKLVQLKSSFERYREVFEKANFHFELQSNAFLERTIAEKNIPWIGIAPFSKHKSKEYSLSKLRKTLELISSKHEVKFFIFGYGENELTLTQELCRDIPNTEIFINSASFTEELNIISSLDLMISMDSGNGHLAANYGIPVITLWGTTHPCLGYGTYAQPLENSLLPNSKRFPFLPVSIFGNNKIASYERAIDSIEVDTIVQRVSKILNS